MAESNGKDIDEDWVTSIFSVMHEFRELDIEVVKRLPASTFMILVEELNKKSKMEEENMSNVKGGSFR